MGDKKPQKTKDPDIRTEEQARRGLSDKAQREIGKQLKSLYDEIVNEPVPDRFTMLLEQLESQEKASGDDRKKE